MKQKSNTSTERTTNKAADLVLILEFSSNSWQGMRTIPIKMCNWAAGNCQRTNRMENQLYQLRVACSIQVNYNETTNRSCKNVLEAQIGLLV